ncbi:MAG: ankyrin repeat domain-containing protein, partial [SAR324 cluster bacterium]|nr:ankyrin repeat domain-containing protein [SAR324 cluster bacterium]
LKKVNIRSCFYTMKPKIKATAKITILQDSSPEDFHSGKRLNRIRKIKGYTQEGLLYEPDFPKVSLKTLRRWEQKGVNPLRLQEVANFFGLDLWGFLENHIGEEEFRALALHPEMHLPMKAKYLYKTNQEPVAYDQQQRNRTEFNKLVELIQKAQNKKFITQIKSFPVNYQGEQGWNLLLWAVHKNQIQIVKYLLKQKSLDPTQGDGEGLTPLMCACTWGYTEATGLLLANQKVLKKINHLDHLGWSALTWACSNGHAQVLESLLQAGSSPDLQDHRQATPLHRAIKENNITIAQVLLNHHADPSILDENAKSPKQLAEGQQDQALIGLFS